MGVELKPCFNVRACLCRKYFYMLECESCLLGTVTYSWLLGVSAIISPTTPFSELSLNRPLYFASQQIKSDVENQGNFVNFLASEVQNAAYKEIADVEEFVKWLDGELSYLVDERAVLKHFPNWPEKKADAMREAAFNYRDLKNLESEASSFHDDRRVATPMALKRMQALQDKWVDGRNASNRMKIAGCLLLFKFYGVILDQEINIISTWLCFPLL